MPDLVVVPVTLLTQGGGHDHVLSVGVSIGPLVLRIALLAAVPVVVGFALLSGFLTEPDRRGLAAVVMCAGVAVVVELLLSGGLTVSQRLVPLLLLLLAVPLYLALSRDPRFAPAVVRARRLAPWVFWPAAVLAAEQFARGWLAGPAVTPLHTGVVLALVALSWFAVSRTRRPTTTVGVRIGAVTLAIALIPSAAQAMVLHGAA